MAGKGLVIAPRRLGYALDALSKNALIDLVADRAMAQIGAEMSDEQLAAEIQGWLSPVIRERGDRPVSLSGLMAKLDKNDEDYRDKTGKSAQVEPKLTSTVSAEAMEAAMTEQRKKPYRWT